MKQLAWCTIAGYALAVGCANDPLYVPSPNNLEAGQQDDQGNTILQAQGSMYLPIKRETTQERQAQQTETQKLGIPVPYVQCDDVAVEVDWTIKNLDGSNAGTALIKLDGANEFWWYEPSILNLSPGNPDDEVPAPDLQGNIPINVPAGGTVNGLFTEDELLEASVDLDLITRGNQNPFAATLTLDNRALPSFQPMTPLMFDAMGNQLPQSPMGKPIPRAAIPYLVRVDLTFVPSTHMVLDWDIRIRDLKGDMVDDLGLSAPASQLQQFNNIMLFQLAGGSGGSGGSGSGSG